MPYHITGQSTKEAHLLCAEMGSGMGRLCRKGNGLGSLAALAISPLFFLSQAIIKLAGRIASIVESAFKGIINIFTPNQRLKGLKQATVEVFLQTIRTLCFAHLEFSCDIVRSIVYSAIGFQAYKEREEWMATLYSDIYDWPSLPTPFIHLQHFPV